MSGKNLKEYRGMNPLELQEQVEKLKNSLYQMRTQRKFGQLKDTSSIKKARRDIARLFSVLEEKGRREAGAAKGAGAADQGA